MNYSPMQNLAEFHDKFDRDGKARHERAISISLVGKRMSLIAEEFAEVNAELRDLQHWLISDQQYEIPAQMELLAKELADLLYVVYGTAEELGIPLEAVFNEVHRSNMDKIWPDGKVHYNEFGKVMKSPTYTPPNLEKILNG